MPENSYNTHDSTVLYTFKYSNTTIFHLSTSCVVKIINMKLLSLKDTLWFPGNQN